MFDFPKWNNSHRFAGFRFTELYSEGRITALHKYFKNGREFNRRKYNNMDYRQQQEFDKAFYIKKTGYGFSIDNSDTWFEIPKSVFEAVKNTIPDIQIIERDFYTKNV